jgi:hypothetical protein
MWNLDHPKKKSFSFPLPVPPSPVPPLPSPQEKAFHPHLHVVHFILNHLFSDQKPQDIKLPLIIEKYA